MIIHIEKFYDFYINACKKFSISPDDYTTFHNDIIVTVSHALDCLLKDPTGGIYSNKLSNGAYILLIPDLSGFVYAIVPTIEERDKILKELLERYSSKENKSLTGVELF
jgi:hypothetical protein